MTSINLLTTSIAILSRFTALARTPIVFLIFTLSTLSVIADVELRKPKQLKLQSYEPNTIGVTKDNNDVVYMDFMLSLKYPMFHKGIPIDYKFRLDTPRFYFAFSTRLGQYIGTRDSSPVIGKRFNPKLFVRYWLGSEYKYFDFGYSHESNGQRINTQSLYEELRKNFAANGEDPAFANDYISRGWDYIDFTFRNGYKENGGLISTYLKLKYFLKDGLLQGEPEEFNEWEDSSGIQHRRSVDGISVITKFSKHFTKDSNRSNLFAGYKVALVYTTGYTPLFKYNSVRLESTLVLKDLPIMLWASSGYNSDLVDYYHRIDSYGIAFELRSFVKDI